MEKEIYEVIGYQKVNFTTKEGTEIKGFNIFISFPARGVEGLKSDKIFMSDRKLDNTMYSPNVGDHISIYYNKFGKPDLIELA